MAEQLGTRGLLGRVRVFLEMVKFSHSIFALPFALSGAWIAAGGMPGARTLLLIVACAVSARTAAMAFNRWADRGIDAANPRTASRALPAGVIAPGAVLLACGVASALFLVFAAMLGPLCLALSPLVLLVLLGYSWTKRFTAAAHLVLGLALALAPMGAWIAVRGSFEGNLLPPLLLGALVLTWVAGFDILYACQDAEFDRRMGLRAVPAKLGVPRALLVARGLHLLAACFAVALSWTTGSGWILAAGVAVFLGLLALQHSLVRADDLSRIDVAFFTVNGWASVLFFLALALDLAWS